MTYLIHIGKKECTRCIIFQLYKKIFAHAQINLSHEFLISKTPMSKNVFFEILDNNANVK